MGNSNRVSVVSFHSLMLTYSFFILNYLSLIEAHDSTVSFCTRFWRFSCCITSRDTIFVCLNLQTKNGFCNIKPIKHNLIFLEVLESKLTSRVLLCLWFCAGTGAYRISFHYYGIKRGEYFIRKSTLVVLWTDQLSILIQLNMGKVKRSVLFQNEPLK